MESPIKLIHKFNKEAGLIDQGYDDFRESSFQIEEALEGLRPEYIIASMHPAVQEQFEGSPRSAKDVARHLTSTAIVSDLEFTYYKASSTLPDTPQWDGTAWEKDLTKAIEQEYQYIEDSSRSMFKILSKDSVQNYYPSLSDVDRLDKACDSIVFAVGSMAKLGLNPQEITKALNVVMHKNFEKLKCPKDEFGKLTKPADFVGPEPLLQEILDNRGKK